MASCGARRYLMEVLEFGTTKSVANLLMFIHIGISYTLNQQVLCRAIHQSYVRGIV